jgi:F-type H+-transporting ATPase subunit gamma
MTDSVANLNHKIKSAGDLQSVVRTMKILASSSIGQYEKAVAALADYYQTIELGLGLCARQSNIGQMKVTASQNNNNNNNNNNRAHNGTIGAIVFGSDQGLVGQFNDVIVDYAVKTLSSLSGKCEVWAVGERVQERLVDSGLSVVGLFEVPESVNAIASLVGRIQMESEARRVGGEYISVYVFHNRPIAGSLYKPIGQRLLPLDMQWHVDSKKVPWPNENLPEVMGKDSTALRALVREYLFINLFRACAESLASENASRLAAMQRAEKNINELLERLHEKYYRLRQTSIDEELFDVISGYEATIKCVPISKLKRAIRRSGTKFHRYLA